MKVLHVITTINRGGAENHICDLVRAQISGGLTVAVAYLKGDGYWASFLRNLGVNVIPLGLKRYGDLAPLLRLRKVITTFLPDIIHAHMPPAELYCRLALLFRTKTKLIITKHNDEPFYRGPGHTVLGHWVARRASHLITVSDSVNAYMQRHLCLSPLMLTTVHHGIDTTPYEKVSPESCSHLRSAWNIADSTLIFGTVARLVPQKSLHVLLNAYALYRDSAHSDSRLVIVGNGPLEVELKKATKDLGLDQYVIWAGFREDIPVVMNTFDVFALTSSYEGFGLVLLEAMAAARPVVASRLSAIPEVVCDGVTGLLCRPGDHNAFAKAFITMEASSLRLSMGLAGSMRAKSDFSISNMVNATNNIYHKSSVR